MIYLTIVVFVAFGLASGLTPDQERRAVEVTQRTSLCGSQREFNSDTLDVTALLQHCRSSGRESFLTCFTRAGGVCDYGETEEQRRLISSRVDWSSASHEYFYNQSSKERCAMEVSHRTSLCGIQRGFNAETLNVTALLQHCRSSGREDLLTCFTRARGDCDNGVTDEHRRSIWSSAVWASASLEYFCSQQSIIEAYQGCLATVSPGIWNCFRSANREVVREMTELARDSEGPLSWDRAKGPLERLGRNKEECVHELLRTNCAYDIANVYGNFMYGSGVYFLDEANHRY